jgi:hypothetical protein
MESLCEMCPQSHLVVIFITSASRMTDSNERSIANPRAYKIHWALDGYWLLTQDHLAKMVAPICRETTFPS